MSTDKRSTRRARRQVVNTTQGAEAEALRYLEAGLTPIRLSPKAKGYPGQLDDNILTRDNLHLLRGKPYGLGVLLGPDHGDAVQIDPDCLEARQVAAELFAALRLPSWSRASANGLPTGLLAKSPDCATKDFKLPPAVAKDKRWAGAEHGVMVLQLRAETTTDKPFNTMSPPSIHPSGEQVQWLCPLEREVPTIGPEELRQLCGLVAFLAVMLRLYPDEGERDSFQMHVGGSLVHAGYDGERVDELQRLLAQLAGDEEWKTRGKGSRSAKKHAKGEPVTGLTELCKSLALPKEAVKCFRDWLVGTAVTEPSIFPDTTKDGRPRATVPNCVVALEQLGVECSFDLFRLDIEVVGSELPPNCNGALTDQMLVAVAELCHQRFRFWPSEMTVLTACRALANRRLLHPVRDYLDGLQWDGTPRLDDWLVRYLKAEDTPYVRAVGAIWSIAAVRRVRQPGCKFDTMPVFESGQGDGKSTAFKILAVRDDWFSDSLSLGVAAREAIEGLAGRWIVEVPEMSGMRKAEVERVKAFLSRDTDRARLAYDRRPTDAKRQCVLVGTTNDETYLRDRTGNRRFWPVRVNVTGSIDLEGLRRDRDMLWAEAAAREAKGESTVLPRELWSVAAAEQAERVEDNAYAGKLASLLGDCQGKIRNTDLYDILQVPVERREGKGALLADAMRQLGWEKPNKDGKLRFGQGKPERCWVRGPQPWPELRAEPPISFGEPWAVIDAEKPTYLSKFEETQRLPN